MSESITLGTSSMVFDVLVADPSWPYKKHHDKRQPFAEDHYPLMKIEDIYGMRCRIHEHTHRNTVVYIWATGPKLHLAVRTFEEWGLFYRGIAHSWTKETKDGYLLNGVGPRPSLVKPITELLLWGSYLEEGRPAKLMNENSPNQICHHRLAHSQKPEIFQDTIEALLGPGVSKLELFARRHRPGWHCTGWELTGHDYRNGGMIV